MAFWAALVEIAKTVVKVLHYLRKVQKALAILRAVDALNRRGGPEALLQTWLVGQATDIAVQGLANVTGLDSRIIGFDTDYLLEKAHTFLSNIQVGLGDQLKAIDIGTLDASITARAKAISEGVAVAGEAASVAHRLRLGDPIILASGEFEHEVIDLRIDGAGIDCVFARTYRSGTAYFGPLGPSWDHSFNVLIRQDTEFTISRLSGRLTEHRFTQHPRFGDAGYDYYAPPNGMDEVIISSPNQSYTMLRPQGIRHLFTSAETVGLHRLSRIEDRFGNYLELTYSATGRLEIIKVNSEHRFVRAAYDEFGRLRLLTDHAGRTVEYCYDEWGMLAAVHGPKTKNGKLHKSERYEYGEVGPTRKLTRIADSDGHIIVENEYETSTGSSAYGRVTRQRVGAGESTYEYVPFPATQAAEAELCDVPAARVLEYQNSGHEIEHVLNGFGNELFRCEKTVTNGQTRTVATVWRYNADGRVIAHIDAEGWLVQYLYDRDLLEGKHNWVDIGTVLADITVSERLGFGNCRGKRVHSIRYPTVSTLEDLAAWYHHLPNALGRPRDEDVITKYAYDAANQLLSQSDPRHTMSLNPDHVESASPTTLGFNEDAPAFRSHQAHLTRYQYGTGPKHQLQRKIFPTRTRPYPIDGVIAVTCVEEFLGTDPRGRITHRRDVGGYDWFSGYYAAPGPKEGYLQWELCPHDDLHFEIGTPDILEASFVGNWQRDANGAKSSGAAGDYVALRLRGERISLWQTTRRGERSGWNAQLAVEMDGVPMSNWDQTAVAEYVLEDLGPGEHGIALRPIPAGRITLGRALSHIRVTYEVDDLGRATTVTDGAGHKISLRYNSSGMIVRREQGPRNLPSVESFDYDAAGRLIRERQEWLLENGSPARQQAFVRTRTYGPNGRLECVVEGGEKARARRTVMHKYDAAGRLRLTIDSRGTRTLFQYDELGRLHHTVRAACSDAQSASDMRYDSAGRVLGRRDGHRGWEWNGRKLPGGGFSSSLTATGRPTVIQNAHGDLRVLSYNKLDQITVDRLFQSWPDGTFKLLSRSEFDYDEQGGLRQTFEALFMPVLTASPVENPDKEYRQSLLAGNVRVSNTEYHLDARGQVVALRDALNNILRHTLDGRGRMLHLAEPEGSRRAFVYDERGNAVRTYEFNPVRHPGSNVITHEEVFVNEHGYDELSRLTSRRDSFGYTWKRRYDSRGFLRSLEDPLGTITKFEYNSFGEERSRQICDAYGTVARSNQFKYDANGNVILARDGAKNSIKMKYDALDRCIAIRFGADDPLLEEKRFYDSSGNLIRRIHRSGLVERREFDRLNRHVRTEIDASNASPALEAASATYTVFEYDAADRLVRHENDHAEVVIERNSRGDAEGERTRVKVPGRERTYELRRTFDVRGKCDGLLFPSGRQVGFTYDATGQLESVTNARAPSAYPGKPENRTSFQIAQYGYTGHRLVGAKFGNGSTLTITYDGRGLSSTLQLSSKNDSTEWHQKCVRDGAGYVRAQDEINGVEHRLRTFRYDPMYQLCEYDDSAGLDIRLDEVAPARSAVAPDNAGGKAGNESLLISLPAPHTSSSFEYDACGNHVKIAEPGLVAFATTPNGLNQYASVAGLLWQYDSDGNQRSDADFAFGYDYANNLLSVTNRVTSQTEVKYQRDALGRVVVEEISGEVKTLLHDGSLLLCEIAASTAVEHTPHPDGSHIIHSASGTEDYWHTFDMVGSLRFVTNSSGAVVTRLAYRPFGALEDPSENANCPVRFRYARMWQSRDSNFYQSHTRTYRPDVGRFLQRDPLFITDDLNPYVYVGNNPLNRFDPTGTEAEAVNDLVLTVPARPRLDLGDFSLQLDETIVGEPIPAATIDIALTWVDRILEGRELIVDALQHTRGAMSSAEYMKGLKALGTALSVVGAGIDAAALYRAWSVGDVQGSFDSGFELALGVSGMAVAASAWWLLALKLSYYAGSWVGTQADTAFTSAAGESIGEVAYEIREFFRTERRVFVPAYTVRSELHGGEYKVYILGNPGEMPQEIEAWFINPHEYTKPGYWRTEQIPRW